ncbi:UDP-N-acetylmuramate dehydrogenase [Bacillus coahuilensis]|uniref:UDP-N-acetylmuramate dehydrogenase n=1 Tax=Bacillus coahuilensis TaxID=408580 RepID=UPI000B1F27A6|nr:UDP-N-acetylmuramate dehydrogenase [Bacillus coahuilensis]
MMSFNIKEELSNILSRQKVKENEPLSHYTFTKTGGNADYLVLPTTYEEVQNLVKYTNEQNIPFTILGNGSNLIVRDGGIRGVVLVLTQMDSITLEDNKIIAQSGATIIDTSRYALAHHLTGLEFACGIPGTVGGAVYMNAGAYGGEVKDVLVSALVLTPDGVLKTLRNEELELEYRSSIIPKENLLVLEATFELREGEVDQIQAKMDELTYLRESKQPLEYPSCGSVFKRPPGLFAGKLIQDSGLQGKTIGGVQVSTKHAGFMVNVNNGTATDYLNLIEFVQNTVHEKFGVMLETEVKVIGEYLESETK